MSRRSSGSLVWLWVLLGVGGFVLLCCAGVVGMSLLWAKGVVDEAARKESARTYPTVNAEDIVSEWKQNPATAASKYESSGATIVGVLCDVSENWFLQGYIELDPVKPSYQLIPKRPHIFIVDEKAKSTLRECKVGDHVAVKCVASGQTHDVPWMNAVTVTKIDPPAGGWPKRKWTRDEFRKMVVGKTQPEVIATFGKPADTLDSPWGTDWKYYGITFDPLTEKTDLWTTLLFKNGKCVDSR